MARIKRGVRAHARHKKILAMAKGYRGRSKSCFRIAKERVEKGLQHAYRDRRDLKNNMRRLWIVRLNAACRNLGIKYSEFMHLLNKNDITLNRKMLSEMAIRTPEAFKNLVSTIHTPIIKEKPIAANTDTSSLQQNHS
jgi:large subunit ribosomal protein L20